MSDCIFCQLIAGKMPTDVVYEDETVFAFKDIEPMAPIHYLFIPKKHIASANAFAEGEETAVVGDIFAAIAKVAKREGFAEEGYRIITNCGKDGNQSVPHLHVHVLAGAPIRFSEFDGQ